jgi:hypothetical protein
MDDAKQFVFKARLYRPAGVLSKLLLERAHQISSLVFSSHGDSSPSANLFDFPMLSHGDTYMFHFKAQFASNWQA